MTCQLAVTPVTRDKDARQRSASVHPLQPLVGILRHSPRKQRNGSHCDFAQRMHREHGGRSEANPRWPRLIEPTLVRSKHTICRMCCSNGKLEEITFTASRHGKFAYHCARASKWGDLLPIKILKEE
ncbi:hypothetical protein J437_LFUL019196 [Ladona fulva]|uniref:Uncharacterized protein n=1 Tax=Ladona fulva TaxID=123851 RepID=A0A8K0KQC2_LADFU|nr:hypothetical protein J437_LFUL019196 [Ladona fulva]